MVQDNNSNTDDQEPGSVSRVIADARGPNAEEAGEQLWKRYIVSLERFARGVLAQSRSGIEDEQDVVNRAFMALLDGLRKNRFEGIRNRRDLWRLLCVIVRRKAITAMARRKLERLTDDLPNPDDMDDPEQQAILKEELRELFSALPNAVLREIAMQHLGGHSNSEIAKSTGYCVRTVERKLSAIWNVWEERSTLES